ncbi:MAG: hypothetical protein RBR20_05505 [Desulfobacterales bacterium]|jgi:hypothetical protein|nr:hypothetical protein [Desulfobacterales bacterium]
MDELLTIVSRLEPETALAQITRVMERLMADLDQDARDRFLMDLVGQSGGDKVSSLVHL